MWSYVYATHSHAYAHYHAEQWLSHKHTMLSSQHHSIIYKNYVVFKWCFYKCCKLHSCVPCGRFFHSAKATFHQPPQHDKQECSFIPFHKSQAIALRVLADAYLRLFFVLENLQKKANPTMHLLNPLQAP